MSIDLLSNIKKDLLNERWRKGGYTSNGLRQSTEVRNYFRTPGRMNIIPDATAKRGTKYQGPISSIGVTEYSGNKLMSEGNYGPGTILSSNIQIRNPTIINDTNQGYMHQNEKKTQFVDYRSTASFLIENLRQNPLSIYAVDDAKKRPIPAFYSYVRPESYETYKSVPHVFIDKGTIQQSIEGNPQTNILGLAQQNPFMGLSIKVNDNPEFNGKTYGGKIDGLAKPYAKKLYDQIWTTNTLEPTTANNKDACQNRALTEFAQGYNISSQIQQGKMIMNTHEGHPVSSNLPWGPRVITNNPQTQQGGIWPKGNNPNPTIPFQNNGVQNNMTSQQGNFTLPHFKYSDCYKEGQPGSLVCN